MTAADLGAAVPRHVECLQHLLGHCPTPADRKTLIITAHACGGLTKEETELLIQANQLETA